MQLQPITLRAANAFVAENHRHHKPVRGCRFCVALVDSSGVLRGVAIVGRPVARLLDDGHTAEVTRLCTDGARNAVSMLMGAVRRACFAIGYARLITYTLPSEGGASLRASGWRLVDDRAGGGSWSRDARPRDDKAPLEAKLRWEVLA